MPESVRTRQGGFGSTMVRYAGVRSTHENRDQDGYTSASWKVLRVREMLCNLSGLSNIALLENWWLRS